MAPLAQSKIIGRANSVKVDRVNELQSLRDRVNEFRQQRKAREEENLRKQREARLLRSAQAAASDFSLSLMGKGPKPPTQRPTRATSKGMVASTSGLSKPKPLIPPTKRPPQANSKGEGASTSGLSKPKPLIPPTKQPPPANSKGKGASTSGLSKPKPLSIPPTLRPPQASSSVKKVLNVNGFNEKSLDNPTKSRKSAKFLTKRMSIKRNKTSNVPSNSTRTAYPRVLSKPPPKAIRHNKASQLRLIHGNSSVELAFHSDKDFLKNFSPLSRLKQDLSTSQLPFLREKLGRRSNSSKPFDGKSSKCESLNEASNTSTPSKITVKKTSFVSPLTTPPVRTPKPACLREKLGQWLENQGRTFDDFKHLNCFGISGSAVKRPQTPHRKKNLSTSLLQAIPESRESSPNAVESSLSDSEDVIKLDSTFTIEEEDKENILSDLSESQKKSSVHSTETEFQFLDKAHGVLCELLKLIKMGYPSDQCELWVRAVRRRFPQCGDEVVYWECLASLEQARGDLQTAMACYERAVAQGGEESVKAALDEIRHKLTALNIDASTSGCVAPSGSQRCLDKGLDSSNIIQSSSIKFVVKENIPSKSDIETDDSINSEAVFTATPVRRSMRSTASPYCKNRSPNNSCVQSLDFLKPNVRKSLVFKNNTALDPRD